MKQLPPFTNLKKNILRNECSPPFFGLTKTLSAIRKTVLDIYSFPLVIFLSIIFS